MGREFNYQVLEPLGVGISAAVLEILGFYWLLGRHEEHYAGTAYWVDGILRYSSTRQPYGMILVLHT